MFFFRRDIFATIKEIEVTIQQLVPMGILRSIHYLPNDYCDHYNNVVHSTNVLKLRYKKYVIIFSERKVNRLKDCSLTLCLQCHYSLATVHYSQMRELT